MKVSLINRKLLKQFFVGLSWIIAVYSFAAVFIDISTINIIIAIVVPIATAILTYIVLLVRANCMKKRKITVNNSTVYLKFGDIFLEKDWKVIAFNEYFDTQVDEKIIAKGTLNGQFINKYITDIPLFDKQISSDPHLIDKEVGENKERKNGKKMRYQLGTIHIHDDYMLTAFSKFRDDNKAILNISDYLEFLMNFWSEVDAFYACRPVSITLFGSGITRFPDFSTINAQELLEIILWTFKLSRVKFTYPACIHIVISPDKQDKISFYDLEEK